MTMPVVDDMEEKLFKLPIGFPVLVCSQIGDYFRVYWAIAMRPEDGYNLGAVYKGKISAVRLHGGWGQNEQLEIVHNIPHVDGKSMTAWAYPDEGEQLVSLFREWDTEARERAIETMAWMAT